MVITVKNNGIIAQTGARLLTQNAEGYHVGQRLDDNTVVTSIQVFRVDAMGLFRPVKVYYKDFSQVQSSQSVFAEYKLQTMAHSLNISTAELKRKCLKNQTYALVCLGEGY